MGTNVSKLTVRDVIHPRDVPGNGLEWDEEAVRRHLVEC
jgi:hypothetical protein